MKRILLAALAAAAIAASIATAGAQTKQPFIIGTGTTGGLYYPIGTGLASILTKNVAGIDAKIEVTGGSLQNMQMIDTGVVNMAFTMADMAWEAYSGIGKFKDHKVPLRTVAVFFPNRNHIVTLDGSGITKFADLKGKRISTGAPTSGTEVIALRMMEAYGFDPNRDFVRERLAVAESVAALRDGKIDAFFWVGGIPTPVIAELGKTKKIRLVDHGEGVDTMRKKFGPIYTRNRVKASSYPGLVAESANLDVWNLVVVPENANEQMVYDITKAMFDKKDDLVKVHQDAGALELATQGTGGSPIPFHPGSLRYYKERGVKF